MIGTDDPNDASPDAGGDEITAFEALFVPRLTSRQRLRRLAVIVGGPVLALLIIFGSLFSIPQRVVLALRGPIPAPTSPPAPGQNNLYLDVDAPWITVTLDGHPLSVPAIGQQPPIALSPGHHTIAWLGAPFQAQNCVLSVPRAPGDSCLPLVEGTLWAEGEPVAQVVHLGEWLATVQPDQRGPLLAALQAAMDTLGGSDTVQPGETYLRGDSGPTVATQPLLAALRLHLEADLTSTGDPPCHSGAPSFDSLTCLTNSMYCQRLCAVPWLLRHALGMPQTRDGWQALTTYIPLWNYTTPDGHIVAADQPIENGSHGVSTQILPITANWTVTQGWQIQPDASFITSTPVTTGDASFSDNPSCVAAEDLFSDGAVPRPPADLTPVRVISAPTPAVGCLIAMNQMVPPSAAAAPGPAPIAYYLERFGMFLAANDLAAALSPQLPRASAYGQALARHLAVLPGRDLLVP